MKAVLFLFALTFALSQTLFAQVAPVSTDAERGYLIGPGDVITIKVLGEPEFSLDAITVDENGKIQLPYSEPVAAKCMSENALRQEVAKAYSRLIRNPQITVIVKERNSRPPVTVYGEIRSPQRVTLTRKATLQDLLAFSGGMTEKASGIIQVTRTQPVLCAEGGDDDWKTFNANGSNLPSRLYSTKSLRDANPVIHPGDLVYVLEASKIYVVGEAIRTGELLIPEGGLPLMQAIAMSSGTTREAKTKDIKIYRRKQGAVQPEVLSVNYDAIKKGTQKDLMLEPFDIVEIGKSKKSVFDIMLEIATGSARNVANTVVRF